MTDFRINADGNSLDISYEEWREYLLFHPSSDLADIISSWRRNTVSSRADMRTAFVPPFRRGRRDGNTDVQAHL